MQIIFTFAIYYRYGSVRKYVSMFYKQFSNIVIAMNCNHRFVRDHNRVYIAIFLSEIFMSLYRFWRFDESDIPDDGVTRRPCRQSFGSSRISPNQRDNYNYNGYCHPHRYTVRNLLSFKLSFILKLGKNNDSCPKDHFL